MFAFGEDDRRRIRIDANVILARNFFPQVVVARDAEEIAEFLATHGILRRSEFLDAVLGVQEQLRVLRDLMPVVTVMMARPAMKPMSMADSGVMDAVVPVTSDLLALDEDVDLLVAIRKDFPDQHIDGLVRIEMVGARGFAGLLDKEYFN